MHAADAEIVKVGGMSSGAVEEETKETKTAKTSHPQSALPQTQDAEARSTLHVIDDRTGRYYSIPILRNAINASDFKRIKAPDSSEYSPDQNEYGLRIFDPGFSNTAVSESAVTYMYGTLSQPLRLIYRYLANNISAMGKKARFSIEDTT